jgi:hypothetical protein
MALGSAVTVKRQDVGDCGAAERQRPGGTVQVRHDGMEKALATHVPVVDAERGKRANNRTGPRKSYRRLLADPHDFRDVIQTQRRIADRGYRGPDLAKPVPELSHGRRATYRDRNADDNRIHLLGASLEASVERTPDRREHNVVNRRAVTVRDGPDVLDPRPGDSQAALVSSCR